jgi:hypothetical protein
MRSAALETPAEAEWLLSVAAVGDDGPGSVLGACPDRYRDQ